MKSALIKSSLLGASALGVLMTSAPAFAAEEDDEIITVTANRVEQDIQDVAASITVFNQEKLSNLNILNAKDIATFTPGVYAQTRFGNDTTTYTIRGFAQEQRTTATVGTYFAEVVAPRGNGAQQGGDGASPGALFDLENVQVLKGPQGTLFGRNTTGGAVLLVPVKPKDQFEAYVEGTVGNLNRFRIQGVVNLPVSETLRLRFGVDRHVRDGYIQNVGIRPRYDDDMGSIDVLALRASAVWDISENIENYTIFTYAESKSSGAIPLIKRVFNPGDFTGTAAERTAQAQAAAKCTAFAAACPLSFGGLARAQVNVEAANGGFWTGTNANPNARAYNEEMRIINRTTIELNDSIKLINLFGYSLLKGDNSVDAFGLNSPGTSTATNPNGFFSFVPINANPDFPLTANQETLVEELRLTGESDRLNWQVGVYYEKSSPRDFTGTMTVTAGSCFNISQFQCSNSTGATINYTKITNKSIAAFAQLTYDITDQLSITGGIRYTEDTTSGLFSNGRIRFTPPLWAANTFECGFPGLPDGGPNPLAVTTRYPNTIENRLSRCFSSARTKTNAPTWTLGLDYKPNEDLLFYAKWARGYRQGSLVPQAPPGLEPFGEEQVDLFEIGAKTSWSGAVSGRFNIAAFYNDFRGQQIQAGINNLDNSVQTTAILNATKSYTQGIEADLMIEPVEWFRLEAAYSYNKTKLKSIDYGPIRAVAGPLGLTVRELPVGGPIPLAVPHAFNATASFMLPVDESVGDITLSGTIVHLSSFRAVADTFAGTNFGVLPKKTFGNVSLTWKEVGGGPIDVAFTVTNVTNEKMFTHINEQSSRGFLAYSVDEQRQYMMRVKYRLGALAD